MSQRPAQDRQVLVGKVRDSLRKTEAVAHELRKTDRRLVVTSISSSAACTLVAGVTAAQGPMLMTGIPGWRLACIVSAGLAFVATVWRDRATYEDRRPSGDSQSMRWPTPITRCRRQHGEQGVAGDHR
jgi:hypothetical protein